MPQRAILDGDVSVLAYNSGDDVWLGFAAAYKAGKLTLSCCGATAIPKENDKGTRWFAHGPYKRIACDWKATDARHEAVVAAICKVAEERGWLVETEVRGEGWKADVVCRREKSEVKVAIQVELRKRPDEEVLAEDAAFATSGIVALWLFTERRKWSHAEVRKADHVPSGEDANTVGEAAARATKFLSRIETAFRNANAAIKALKAAGWQASPVFDLNVPVAVKAVRPSDGHEVTLRTETRVDLDIVNGYGVQRHAEAQLQKELADALRGRLARGVELWWPGYPYLAADTFDRLKAEARKERPVRAVQRAPAPPSLDPHLSLPEPPWTPPTDWKHQPYWESPADWRSHDPTLIEAARRGDKAEPPEFDQWGEARARIIRAAALTVMTAEEADEWMDTRNETLKGLSPNELAASSSSAIDDCEVALGLRDPVTRDKIYPNGSSR